MASQGLDLGDPGANLETFLTGGDPSLSTINSPGLNLLPSHPVISHPSLGHPPSALLAASPQNQDAHVVILEQPRSRGIRFRYKCEGRSAGSIPGETSTDENRTYPTIRIENYSGPAAIVVVSCVTKDEPHRPHPHTLVGRDCQKGVCTVKLKSTNVATFPSLGIQCMTKREINDSLKERESIKVDPYGTGFFDKTNNLDLNIVRLCFQVFLPDRSTGRFTRIVNPVVSHPIYDKKAVNELVICRLSKQAGHAKGGDEVFMLCEKVNKDEIDVVFYEESNGERSWQAYGEFAPTDVHRQFAIVFRTPPYIDRHIRAPKSVYLQLVRKTDNECSDPKPFQYIPDDPDPEQILSKRKRKQLNYSNFLLDESSNSPAIPTTVTNIAQDEGRSMNIRGRLRGMVSHRGRGKRGRPPKTGGTGHRDVTPQLSTPMDESSNLSTQDFGGMPGGMNAVFDSGMISVPPLAISSAKAAYTPTSSMAASSMANSSMATSSMATVSGTGDDGISSFMSSDIRLLPTQILPNSSSVPMSLPQKDQEDVMLSDLEPQPSISNSFALQVSDSMLSRYMTDDVTGGHIPVDMSLSFGLTNLETDSGPAETVAQNTTLSTEGNAQK